MNKICLLVLATCIGNLCIAQKPKSITYSKSDSVKINQFDWSQSPITFKEPVKRDTIECYIECSMYYEDKHELPIITKKGYVERINGWYISDKVFDHKKKLLDENWIIWNVKFKTNPLQEPLTGQP